MAYLKFNKSTVVSERLKSALNSLQTITSNVDIFVQGCEHKPDNLIGWEDEYDSSLGKYIWKKKWDWTDNYYKFIKENDKIKKRNEEMKKGGQQRLSNLYDSVSKMIELIERFEASKFSLEYAYEGKENVSVVYDEASAVEVLVYTTPDGTQYTMSEMLNAFYTYTGMSMDGQLQGALFAEEAGIEFNGAYQSNILAGVNATVKSMNDVGLFGVASQDDILAVNSKLIGDSKSKLYVDDDGNLINNVGGRWSSNMEVGSRYLTTYTIADFITNPNEAVDSGIREPYVRRLDAGVKNEPVPVRNSYRGGSYGGGSYGGGSYGASEPTVLETVPETNKNANSLTQDEIKDISKEINTISGVDSYQKVQANVSEDYDDLARDKYESMDAETLAEHRGNVAVEAERLFASEDKTELKQQLAAYGYDDKDIEQIIQSEEATISAMIEGDQRQTMADIAKDIAKEDGVSDFDSVYDDKQEYRNYQEDSSGSVIANRSEDPEVQKAKDEYRESKQEYKDSVDSVNQSIDNVNAAKGEIDQFKKDHGTDASKWTEKEIEEYHEKVDNYNDSVDDMNDKKDKMDIAEDKYIEAKDNYEEAKQNFENRINEENSNDSGDLNEREEEQSYVDVEIDSEQLLPDTGEGSVEVDNMSDFSPDKIETMETVMGEDVVNSDVNANSRIANQYLNDFNKFEDENNRDDFAEDINGAIQENIVDKFAAFSENHGEDTNFEVLEQDNSSYTQDFSDDFGMISEVDLSTGEISDNQVSNVDEVMVLPVEGVEEKAPFEKIYDSINTEFLLNKLGSTTDEVVIGDQNLLEVANQYASSKKEE